MIKSCLLIPVYNHGKPLAATLERLAPLGLPCLLVDDGSDADTRKTLDALARTYDWVSLHRLPENRGKGAATLHGFAWAHALGYTHAVQIDADGQHDTDDIPALLALARRHPQALISGWPHYGDDIPPARRYGRHVTHVWVWIETLSLKIKDSMCGFRVYPLAECLALPRHRIGRRMDFDTDIMVRLYWAGVEPLFVRTRVRYPTGGASHFDVWRDNLRISWLHTRLFFGLWPRLPRLLRQRWSPPAHWAEQPERGADWGLRFTLWCYRVLGRRAVLCLLYPIVGYFFLTRRAPRTASLTYLRRLRTQYPQALPAPPGWRQAFRHFLAFGRSLVDRLDAWTGALQRADVRFDQRDLLQAQAASGRGAVLLASHLGNLELCRALVDQAPDLRINVLVFTDNARRFQKTLERANARAGLELIPISTLGPDTAARLDRKINQGEFVVIAADRLSPNTADRVITAPFLGHPAPFPQGPFILASLMACPVYLLFALREDAHYRIHLEPFAEPLSLPRAERRQRLEAYAARYAERLEHYCSRAPYQWFNFFDFWHERTTPNAA